MAARRRKSQAKKPQRQTPGWVLAGGGVLAGLTIATLLFIGGVIDSDSPLLPQDQTRPDVGQDTPAREQAEQRETEYTFYEQLQQREVTVPDNPSVAPRTEPGDAVQPDYLVQAGSFRRHDEAEGVKAQLAFLGLSATIQAVDVSGTRWHRVVLGPFESRREADHVQRQLRENAFDAQLREIAPGE